MKTILFLSALLISGLVSCSTRNVSVQQAEEGVVINGIRWATRNVGAPGRFASHPESAGRLFTWYEAQNVCPPGWRLPTREELRNLRDAAGDWTTRGRINGHTFEGKESNRIFLPVTGIRDANGVLRLVAANNGYYWSSSPRTGGRSGAMALQIQQGTISVRNIYRYNGLSVRCVAE